MGQRRPGELVGHQLGGFEVHVPLDEPGKDGEPVRVEGLPALVPGSDPRDVLGAHRHVGLEQLPGEHGGHPAALQHEVGWFVAPGHRQSPPQAASELLPRHAD